MSIVGCDCFTVIVVHVTLKDLKSNNLKSYSTQLSDKVSSNVFTPLVYDSFDDTIGLIPHKNQNVQTLPCKKCPKHMENNNKVP